MKRKTCVCCKKSLGVDNFGNNKRSKDGLAKYCKPCNNELMRVSRERRLKADPDAYKAKLKGYALTRALKDCGVNS